jgi:hypothetical protein
MMQLEYHRKSLKAKYLIVPNKRQQDQQLNIDDYKKPQQTSSMSLPFFCLSHVNIALHFFQRAPGLSFSDLPAACHLIYFSLFF